MIEQTNSQEQGRPDKGTFVNIGCGWDSPDGWMNFDGSPTLRFERMPFIGRLYVKNSKRFPVDVEYGNIVTGLPLEDGSVDGVYASHVLEHLCRQDFYKSLRNIRRLLKPGGVLRLIVPDLLSRSRHYLTLAEQGDPAANNFFLESTLLGLTDEPRSKIAGVISALGNSAHKWMWDDLAIESALREADFCRIRRCSFGDAENLVFKQVERRDRFYWLPPSGGEEIEECAFEAFCS